MDTALKQCISWNNRPVKDSELLSVLKYFLISMILITSLPFLGAEQDPSRLGLMDFGATYYLDSREFNTMTFDYHYDIAGKMHGWQFHGYTDLFSLPKDLQTTSPKTGRADLSHWYTENRVTRMIGRDEGAYTFFGIQLEHSDGNGIDDNLLRLGLVYTAPFVPSKFLQIRVLPLQSDGEGGQISIINQFQFIDNTIALEGFFDYNYFNDGRDPIIHSEIQLRYMLRPGFGVTGEYRYNEALTDSSGFAIGATVQF